MEVSGDDESMSNGGDEVPLAMLMALLRPAWVRTGGVVIDSYQQLRLHDWLDALSAILTSGLNDGGHPQEVRFEWMAAAAASEGAREELLEHRFGFVLSSATDPTAAICTLDGAAIRAIVDLITTQLADLRGAAEVTQTDHGLLEFAVLSALDELCLVSRSGELPLALSRFLGKAELIERTLFSSLEPLRLRVTVGARAGSGAVWIRPGPISLAVPEGPTFASRPLSAAQAPVSLQIELPLAEGDEVVGSLPQVGEIVEFQTTNHTSFASGSRIVSDTGWFLSWGNVTEFARDRVSIRCGALRPTVADRSDPPSLRARLGRRDLALEQLRMWREGDVLDFAIPQPDAPIEIVASDGGRARGVWNTHPGEGGVRIVELLPSPDGSAGAD